MEQPTQPQQPEQKRKQTRVIIFLFLFLGSTVALVLWMMISRIWPANKLIDLQAGWFNGEYYPKITFGILWIIILLLFVVIGSFFSWIWDKVKGQK